MMLKIRDYEILRPRSDQSLVNYGVWIEFSKPQKQRTPAKR